MHEYTAAAPGREGAGRGGGLTGNNNPGLAFRHFHSTQYVRHSSRPEYTPEPDLVHEALGHLPMLLNPDFAAMAQAIGEASLDATEAQIWHLTKVYWYTVEFGVVR